MLLDQMICQDHGWFGHLGIHEAGHATVAILLDFEFTEVFINPGEEVYRLLQLDQDGIAAAVVMSTDEPTKWVGPRPEDALVYLLAGSTAENEIIGHHLKRGHRGDMVMWRHGTGRSAVQTTEQEVELRPLIREGREGRERTEELVRENQSAILRVYNLMQKRVSNNGRTFTDFNERLVLSYSEVRAAVLGTT